MNGSLFLTRFEDKRHERSFLLLLSLVEPKLIKQSKFTDQEKNSMINLALEKLYRQRILKESVVVSLREQNSFFYIINIDQSKFK